jgi:hypothetical protein
MKELIEKYKELLRIAESNLVEMNKLKIKDIAMVMESQILIYRSFIAELEAIQSKNDEYVTWNELNSKLFG